MSLPKGPTEMTLVSQNSSTNIKALMFTVAELLYIYIPIMNLLCIFFYMCSIKTEQTSLSKTLILRFFFVSTTHQAHTASWACESPPWEAHGDCAATNHFGSAPVNDEFRRRRKELRTSSLSGHNLDPLDAGANFFWISGIQKTRKS